MRPLRIAYHAYSLHPRDAFGNVASGQARKGALLRVQYPGGEQGYADCHPWPELGDLSLTMQLKKLQTGEWTDLLLRSMEFAWTDAQARSQGLNLLDVCAIPPSHFLMPCLERFTPESLEHCVSQGFRRIKIKLGKNPLEEGQYLVKQLDPLRALLSSVKVKFRLDFNSSMTEDQVHVFLAQIQPILDFLDFIEDPTPFVASAWENIQKRWGIRLALDRFPVTQFESLTPGAFSIVVFKPAIQSMEKIKALALRLDCPLAVTSYLDHPLGQLCAAKAAGVLQSDPRLKIEEGGLLSHSAYKENDFSSALRTNGPFLLPSPGTGFGLNERLAALTWSPLQGETA